MGLPGLSRIGGDQDPAAATIRDQAHGQYARQFGDEAVGLGEVEGGGDLQPAVAGEPIASGRWL
jgi:hypothetical protein